MLFSEYRGAFLREKGSQLSKSACRLWITVCDWIFCKNGSLRGGTLEAPQCHERNCGGRGGMSGVDGSKVERLATGAADMKAVVLDAVASKGECQKLP